MTDKLETIYVYIIGVTDWFKRALMKVFPYAAAMFGFIFIIGLAGGADRGNLTSQDIPRIAIVAMGFTILVLLYVVALLKNRGE